MPDTFNIKNIEIFSVGKWNGNEITEKDIDAIIDTFESNKDTIKPFLKLGHDDKQELLQKDGYPAAGYVSSLRKVGQKLVADFENIPKKVYELIKLGAYKKVSCEIYSNIDICGKIYKKLLSGVALLGANMPAVLNLSDMLALYNINLKDGSEVQTIEYTINQGEAEMTEEKKVEEVVEEVVVEAVEQDTAELDAAKKELEDAKAELEELKKFKAEADAQILEAKQKEAAAELEKYVSELKKDELLTPATEKMVRELVGDVKEEYSIEEKTFSKNELVKELLKLTKESFKINTEEKTEDGKIEPLDKDAELLAAINQYQRDNKVSFSVAYQNVMRNQ